MARNYAGGFAFAVDDMTRFKRFLILGGVGGTYYVGERPLIKENLEALERLLAAGRGKEAVDLIVSISTAGRAPSNDPALFALARICAWYGQGKISQVIPAEKVYTLHKDHHPDLFARIADGETVIAYKKGESAAKKTFVRTGDHITLTVTRTITMRMIDHPEDTAVRQYALSVLPEVARTGTHLLHFQMYVEQFRGRGRALQRATREWFQQKPLERLAYQALKYPSRSGWAQRDLLRLAHPNPMKVPGNSAAYSPRNSLYRWITKGWGKEEAHVAVEEGLALIAAHEAAKSTQQPKEVARLIRQYHLPREALLTEHLRSRDVWEALLEDMPLEALMRNLANMTRYGVLEAMGSFTRSVVTRLHDHEAIRRARLHPIKILAALSTYAAGHGVRSERIWTPLPEIIDALSAAFYLAFEGVLPIRERLLIAIDVSSSMHGTLVNGIAGMQCHTAASAMALLFAKSAWRESASGIHIPNYTVIGFDTSAHALNISPEQRLDDVLRTVKTAGGGGTNCAIPMLWARRQRREVDAFVLLTDSESWHGSSHPVQELALYRSEFNPEARIINVQMAATRTTTLDPKDHLALEVVGFDTSVPELLTGFIGGAI
jgi:60 kDa SS-A/Ro ribonucleoprotein